MGLRVYKVKLYKINDNFNYESTCDIFVTETPYGIIEISTYYRLTTLTRNCKKRNNCKYVIFGNELNDDNLVSLSEVDNYLSEHNNEWYKIYNDEICNNERNKPNILKKLFSHLN